jgi:hypothetical protein
MALATDAKIKSSNRCVSPARSTQGYAKKFGGLSRREKAARVLAVCVNHRFDALAAGR